MPTETKKNSVANQTDLEAWVPTIIPALRTRWAKETTGLLADRSAPKMSDWLTLLHTAAVNPQRIPRYLSRLLQISQTGAHPQKNLYILSKLFELTAEALQDKFNELDATAARHLLTIQNRILKSAASLPVATTDRLPTDALAQQSRYVQAVFDLNKKIITAKNANELLKNIVVLIQQIFGYQYLNLFLFDPAKQTLTLQHAIWQNQPSNKKDLANIEAGKQSITARAAATGRLILVRNIADNSDFTPHPFWPHLNTQLSIPLLAGTNMVGVLDVASDQPDAFAEDDCHILSALGSQIALAFENARLQEQLRHHLHEQKLLYESNLALGTSLDTDTILKLIAPKVVEALAVEACTICKFDKKASLITNLAEFVASGPGHPPRTWRELNKPLSITEDPISQQVIKTNRPIIDRADAEKPANWQQPGEFDLGWGTVLALPLETEDHLIGLMEIYDVNPERTFSAEEIQLCQILASQTTLAMERAQLFDETRKRLNEVSTLYTMAQDIASTLDLQGILEAIVVSLRHVIGCRGCCIFLLDPQEQKLEIRAADGLKPQWKEMAKLNVGEGAAGRAVAQKRTIYIPDTRQETDFIFFDDDVRSLMVIPLVSQGEIIGAINLDDRKPNAFGPAQEQLLTIAAAQAGIAIENARLFTRVAAEQQQTQAIIQYMADGLLLIDDHGVIVTYNPALAMMLGIPPGQIMGQKVDSPDLHPNLASITGTTTQRARTGVLAKEVNIETPHPRTLQIFSTVMVDDNKKPIGEVRVVHDVTKERELEQLKEEFMSTISHELRTPLFSIQGFIQILLENEEELDAPTRQEFLSIIQTQAVQLSEMVNNLLDASKFDEGKLKFERQPVAMLAVLQQTLLKLRGFAHQQKVKLESELAPTLPAIIGDKERLEQVLTNLIGNAIKFTPADGTVTVSASTTDQEILIQVKDTGIGIPPQVQKHIFSRYYQVENQPSEGSKRGSGLGLYIAQQTIEGHGGQIWVESDGIPGRGSTFSFTLPLPDTPVEI